MARDHFGKEAARHYSEGPPRQVPGYAGLHRMVELLLAERMPPDGNLLVLGAGGGLELRALAEARPGWRFEGVDPSGPMLRRAREVAGPHAARMRFHQGYIDSAPQGPFDAATSLLTFHFIPLPERLETLAQIYRRLRLGAPFVLAHLSFPQFEPQRSLWIDRHLEFSGTDPAAREMAREAMKTQLSILPPEQEEAMLAEAGFSGIELFYAGLGFRGWVAYA